MSAVHPAPTRDDAIATRSSHRLGPTPDDAVAALSRRQHGAWNHRQALEVGMTSTMVATRVRRRIWIPQDHGVYAHAASMPTWHRSVMVAVLAEPWAVASHRTAAVLHGLPGFRPGRPEITIRPGANARGRLATAHRGIDVLTTNVGGIPTVSLSQVIVDLAQLPTEARVQDALAALVPQHPNLLPQLRDRYLALAPRGGRNLRALRRILEGFGDDHMMAESVLDVLQGIVRTPEIPAVSWQASFPGRTPGPNRVDGLIEKWTTVLEADGRSWHTRVKDFDRDRRRDAEAAANGFQTLRFSGSQLPTSRAGSVR